MIYQVTDRMTIKEADAMQKTFVLFRINRFDKFSGDERKNIRIPGLINTVRPKKLKCYAYRDNTIVHSSILRAFTQSKDWFEKSLEKLKRKKAMLLSSHVKRSGKDRRSGSDRRWNGNALRPNVFE